MAVNKVEYAGKVLLDLTEDTVTADMMESGAKAHDKTGALITGSIPVNSGLIGAVKEEDVKYSKEQTDFGTIRYVNINPRIYPSDKQEQIILRGDQQRCNMDISALFFGNARPSEVKKGVTFTSLNGLKITGTADMSGGTDTSDATATASDILTGKTAYGKDGKISGSMADNGAVNKSISGKSESCTIPKGYHDGNGKIGIDSSEQAKIIPENIKKGVSILGVTGSYEATASGGSSENNCEAYLVDVTNPTVSFKKTSGTIKAYGYAYATTSSGWGGSRTTMYAFNGTNYYKSVSYGSPSATDITLSVSGGKLTGLPSELSGGTLLVVRGI